MRKVLLAAAIFFTAAAANAQATFGVHVNGILASGKDEYEATDPDDSYSDKYKGRFSWKVGVVASVPLSDALSFMPQLNLLSKGGTFEDSESESGTGYSYFYEQELKSKFTYLELPLNVVYNTGSFFIGAGPSLSYGLGGKVDYMEKATVTVLGDTETEEESGTIDVKFDGKKQQDVNDNKAHAKAFELGANFIAGYKLANGLFIQANYNLGLSNINPYENATTKNNYVGIGIGYFFGGGGYARK